MQGRVVAKELALVLAGITIDIFFYHLTRESTISDPIIEVLHQRHFMRHGQIGEFEIIADVSIEFGEIRRVGLSVIHQLTQTLLLQFHTFGIRKCRPLSHKAFSLCKFYRFHCLYLLSLYLMFVVEAAHSKNPKPPMAVSIRST